MILSRKLQLLSILYMSDSSVEPVWMPNYDTGIRLGDLPRKSNRVDQSGFGRISSARHKLPALTISRAAKSRINAERLYVTTMAAGLSFDDDVVRERCFQADPFNSHFMTSLNQLRRVPTKRLRNDISYLSKPVDPQTYLKPMKPAKSSCVKPRPSVTPDLETTHVRSQPADISRHDSQEVSLSWVKSASNNDKLISSDEEWDECLLQKLSANTARWLAQSSLTSEDDHKRLHRILDATHGPTNSDSQVELVKDRDDHGETVEADAVKEEKKPWLSEKDM